MSLRFFQLYSQIYSLNFIQNCFILSPLLQDLYLFILSVLLTTQISLFKYFYHNRLKGFITFCKFVPKLVSLLFLSFLSTLTLANSWFFLRFFSTSIHIKYISCSRDNYLFPPTPTSTGFLEKLYFTEDIRFIF